MSAIQLFKDNKRTYASWQNAKKIIDNLDIEGNYMWQIGATEDGRFYPHVMIENTQDINFHYLINQGCCVSLI